MVQKDEEGEGDVMMMMKVTPNFATLRYDFSAIYEGQGSPGGGYPPPSVRGFT